MRYFLYKISANVLGNNLEAASNSTYVVTDVLSFTDNFYPESTKLTLKLCQ